MRSSAGVEAYLCNGPTRQVSYPPGCNAENWLENVEAIKASNDFASLRDQGNLYAIFVAGESDVWVVKYVGKSNRQNLGTRLSQHFGQSDGIHSKLPEIKEAVSRGQSVGFSYADIRPDLLNVYVEAWIQTSCEPPWVHRKEGGR